ncbi:hypothetical protein [Antarctobacter sp.]|uniref:hypothetical protein n=1 Tax=Antarctobacter sp. TaxID=1872577 RepID=UPI002B27810E|nr:hypothetical protein [Antarctobacter sp.]
MSVSKMAQIKGVTLSETLMIKALEAVPEQGFSKTAFGDALVDQGINAAQDGDFVRRVMQHLKQAGWIDFDGTAQSWHLTSFGQLRLPQKTIPLVPALSSASATMLPSNRLDRWAEHGRLTIGAVACLTLLMALVGLNASFAWELGREAAQFQILFTMGVMALDMMRPGFVMIGFYLNGRGRYALGTIALSMALTLSPVSVLSTTSILSASFLLGAEINRDADTRAQTLEALRVQHESLLQRAAQDEAAWRQECARGGCGRIAAELETAFQTTVAEAQAVLDRIVSLTEAEQGNSELLARMIKTFENLGLFGGDRQILLPLFLAISLELGALFGPALLLQRRTQTMTRS